MTDYVAKYDICHSLDLLKFYLPEMMGKPNDVRWKLSKKAVMREREYRNLGDKERKQVREAAAKIDEFRKALDATVEADSQRYRYEKIFIKLDPYKDFIMENLGEMSITEMAHYCRIMTSSLRVYIHQEPEVKAVYEAKCLTSRRLSKNEKSVMELMFRVGLSIAEISRKLDVSENTVAKWKTKWEENNGKL